MAAKAILVLCAQALLIQSGFSQCLGRAGLYDGLAAPFGLAGRGLTYDGLAFDGLAAPLGLAGRGWGYDGLGLGCGCAPGIDYTVTSGGGLPVISSSAIPPVGVSVASENVYEGVLAAAGEVPYIGTVGVEGVLPTAGAGAVNYGGGNGATAMVATDGLIAPAIGAFAPAIGAFGPGIGAFGPGIGAFGAGIAAPGLGFGAEWAGRGCGCGCGRI